MKIFTKEVLELLPSLEDLEDPVTEETIVPLKIFNPTGLGTWYILAKTNDIMFGICCLQEVELGYVSSSELLDLELPFGLSVERDITYDGGKKTIKDVKEQLRRNRNESCLTFIRSKKEA